MSDGDTTLRIVHWSYPSTTVRQIRWHSSQRVWEGDALRPQPSRHMPGGELDISNANQFGCVVAQPWRSGPS